MVWHSSNFSYVASFTLLQVFVEAGQDFILADTIRYTLFVGSILSIACVLIS